MNQITKNELWQKIFKEGLILEVKTPDYAQIDGVSFKKLRNELNYSQRKFAEILGVSIKTIEKWEQGKNPLTGVALRLIYLLDNDRSLINKLYCEDFPQQTSSIKKQHSANHVGQDNLKNVVIKKRADKPSQLNSTNNKPRTSY